MRKRLAELFDKLTSRLDLAAYVWAGLSLVSGYITGHFAALNAWIASFGPIGYWTAGLLGALLVAIIGAILARIRVWWITGAAIDKWKRDVSTINPLETQFSGLVIRLQDLAHPVTRRIENKTFLNCELMGPATLYLINGNHFQNVGFGSCDIAVTRPNTALYTVSGMENVTIIGGKIWNCTIFISPGDVATFQGMGASFITYLPGEAVGTQSLPSTAPGTSL